MTDKEPFGEEIINPEESDGLHGEETASGDESVAEPEATAESEVAEESAISDAPDEIYFEKTEGGEAVKPTSNYMPLAAVLSCAAILSLCALMLFITLGAMINDQREAVYLQVSGYNPQVSYSDDSEMIGEFLNSVVVIGVEKKSGSGGGSGIIISENGYIVTNYHVVQNATNIYVTLYGDDGAFKAELVGHSEVDDIAVLKIDKNGLRPATFVQNCSDCRLGERVYAIGAPEGSDYGWTVSQGIISSVNRELKIYNSSTRELEKKTRVIQTDTAVNHGNSGGPLINARGEVVGIVTAKLESYIQKNGELKVIDGLGFALPSDGVLPIVEAIIETGSADGIESTISSGRPLMGISCNNVTKGKYYSIESGKLQAVDKAHADKNPHSTFYADEDGVCVISTTQGLDADGKLLAGDVITNINGKRVYTADQLISFINDLHDGDQIEITYLRGGKTYTVTITLTEAPIK